MIDITSLRRTGFRGLGVTVQFIVGDEDNVKSSAEVS
jgi:hypothetical protein